MTSARESSKYPCPRFSAFEGCWIPRRPLFRSASSAVMLFLFFTRKKCRNGHTTLRSSYGRSVQPLMHRVESSHLRHGSVLEHALRGVSMRYNRRRDLRHQILQLRVLDRRQQCARHSRDHRVVIADLDLQEGLVELRALE